MFLKNMEQGRMFLKNGRTSTGWQDVSLKNMAEHDVSKEHGRKNTAACF